MDMKQRRSSGGASTRQSMYSAQSEDCSLGEDRPVEGRVRFRDRLKAAWTTHREAKEKNQYERVHNKVLRLHHVLRTKRELNHRDGCRSLPVGNLSVALLNGFFYTPRPYFILELDGNEERTEVAMTSTPNWEDPTQERTRFKFPVYDASSDLRIFLFDDNSHHHQRCRGRVIIPLRSLCTKGLFCMPKPAITARYKLMPPSGQLGHEPEMRFKEAVPGVPGTGMVKPDNDIGELVLRLQLELTAPGAKTFGLLAAYAQLPAGGRDDEDDYDSSCSEPESSRMRARTSMQSEESQSLTPSFKPDSWKPEKPPEELKPNSKVIRAYTMRLKRCLNTAYVLKSPWCFFLPFLWYLVCFHMAAFMMPWVLMSLFVANGILGWLKPEDRTRNMIFWEKEIGSSQVPRGIEKLRAIRRHIGVVQKALIHVTQFLERREHTFDFTDPSVSIVAFGFLLVICAMTSFVLYVFKMSHIIFSLGLVAMFPCLKSACRERNPESAGENSVQTRRRSSDEDDCDLKRHRKGRCRRIKKVFQEGARMVRNILSRIPDSSDIAHEYFCTVEQRLSQVGSDQCTPSIM